jgi:hypothetical protein
MHNNQGNHKNGILPKKKQTLMKGKFHGIFLALGQSIHHNGQIPIFEVPYKYIKNSLQAS